jgi:hypothetical protein
MGLRVGNWTHAIEIRDRVIGRGRKGEIDIRELGGKSLRYTESIYADVNARSPMALQLSTRAPFARTESRPGSDSKRSL